MNTLRDSRMLHIEIKCCNTLNQMNIYGATMSD